MADKLMKTLTINGVVYEIVDEDARVNIDTLQRSFNNTSDMLLNELNEKANSDHKHNLSSDSITGVLPLNKGGLEATTAEGARAKIGAAAINHTHDANDVNIVYSVSEPTNPVAGMIWLQP